MPDIEFATIIKKRPVDIWLKDKGFCLAIMMLLSSFNQVYHFASLCHSDTISSIRVLARFHDPNFFRLILVLLEKFFKLSIIRSFNIISFGNVIKWVGF